MSASETFLHAHSCFIESGLLLADACPITFQHAERGEAMEEPVERVERPSRSQPEHLLDHHYYQVLQDYYQTLREHHRSLMEHHRSLMEHHRIVQALFQ